MWVARVGKMRDVSFEKGYVPGAKRCDFVPRVAGKVAQQSAYRSLDTITAQSLYLLHRRVDERSVWVERHDLVIALRTLRSRKNSGDVRQANVLGWMSNLIRTHRRIRTLNLHWLTGHMSQRSGMNAVMHGRGTQYPTDSSTCVTSIAAKTARKHRP